MVQYGSRIDLKSIWDQIQENRRSNKSPQFKAAEHWLTLSEPDRRSGCILVICHVGNAKDPPCDSIFLQLISSLIMTERHREGGTVDQQLAKFPTWMQLQWSYLNIQCRCIYNAIPKQGNKLSLILRRPLWLHSTTGWSEPLEGRIGSGPQSVLTWIS